MGDVDRVAGLHRGDALGAPCGHGDDAEQRDADAEMRERGAPGRARQARRRAAAPRRAARAGPVRSTISMTAPAMTKSASPTPNGASTGPPCSSANAGGDADRRDDRGGDQTLRGAEKIAALPPQQRSERHRQQQRHE